MLPGRPNYWWSTKENSEMQSSSSDSSKLQLSINISAVEVYYSWINLGGTLPKESCRSSNASRRCLPTGGGNLHNPTLHEISVVSLFPRCVISSGPGNHINITQKKEIISKNIRGGGGYNTITRFLCISFLVDTPQSQRLLPAWVKKPGA